MDTNKEFLDLKSLHESAVLLTEGGNPVVLLPNFPLKVNDRDMRMDLLLHPGFHSGYVTRLFFKEKVDGKGQNWTPHQVIGRAWWAPSWKEVRAEQPWPAMLCAHLRVLI